MAKRAIDFSETDIGSLRPPKGRRMVDFKDKRQPALALRVIEGLKGQVSATWNWRYVGADKKTHRINYGRWPSMTYEAAVIAHQEARRRRGAGTDPIGTKEDTGRDLEGRMTVAAMVDAYALSGALKLKDPTETLRLMRKHIVPALGDKAAEAVTSKDIKRVLYAERDRIAAENEERAKRNPEAQQRSGIVVTRLLSAFGSLFTWAVSRDLVDVSPVPKAKTLDLAKERGKRRPLSVDELGRFWAWLPAARFDDRTVRALQLILLTGCRPSEILELRHRDVNFAETFVDRRGGSPVVREGGIVTILDTKNGSTVKVPLSDPARAILAAAIKAAPVGGKDAFIFANADDHSLPMTSHVLARAISRRRTFFQFENGKVLVTPHCLRATAADLVLRLGFSQATAQAVLNHRDGSVLASNYSDFDGLPERYDALHAIATEVERLGAATPSWAQAQLPDGEVVAMPRAVAGA